MFQGSTSDKPIYYGPQDFLIGSLIYVFKHRFKIIGADLYVLKFAEDHSDKFPQETLDNLRQALGHISGRVDAKERNNVNLRRRYLKARTSFRYENSTEKKNL